MAGRLEDIINLTQPLAGVNESAVQRPLVPPMPPQPGPTMDFRAGQSMAFATGGLVPTGAMAAGPQGMPQGAGPAGPQLSFDQMQGEAQRVAQQHPEVMQQIQASLQAALESGNLTPQQLNMAIQMATAAAQNPNMYPRLRQLAIQQGLVDEDELPMQYDQGIVMALLLAGQAVQQQSATGVGAAPAAGAPVMATGGYLPPQASPTGDNTGTRDDINIKVSGGEYVIPAHIVERKGTEFFDKLVGKDEKAQPK